MGTNEYHDPYFADGILISLRHVGWSDEDIVRLREEEGLLADFLDVLHGRAVIQRFDEMIFGDLPDTAPAAWKIEESDDGMCRNLTLSDLTTYDADPIEETPDIVRKSFSEEGIVSLPGTTPLEWLLKHPDQCPADWRRDTAHSIFFLGTLYRAEDDRFMVRGLTLRGSDIEECHLALSAPFPKNSSVVTVEN